MHTPKKEHTKMRSSQFGSTTTSYTRNKISLFRPPALDIASPWLSLFNLS